MKLLSLLIVICFGSCTTDKYPFELEEFDVLDGGYKCMVIGDWGKRGDVHELANAHMMNELACRIRIDEVITTGDNFYPNGVESINDPHWGESYENVFDGECLRSLPWWASLGNHDANGNTEAQVQYAQQSDRWNMPDLYYDRWVTSDDSMSIHFITVFTEPFVSAAQEVATTRQLHWLDSVLAVGDPDWLVVNGHHPVYSADGYHGSTQVLIEKFAPRFEANGVDVYFCGHNHSLELIRPDQHTFYVTSGGGAMAQDRIDNLPYNIFGVAHRGFVLSTFTKESLQLDFISKEGNRLYSHISPRTP